MGKVRTEADFLALTISAGKGKPEASPAGPNYRFRVAVDSDATGVRIFFDYHDSVHNRTNHVDQLDREGLLYAFWAFVQDAGAGSMSFADYCHEYGANDDSMAERRIWGACRSSAKKFGRLFHDAERFTPEFVLEQLAVEGIE